MLKNQESIPEPPLTVSQARVTPAELTAALASIEAKRQAEASRLAGTIPLDQAVSELHLDSTSDEIWAEVQKQRAKASEAKASEAKASETQQELSRPTQAVPQVLPASKQKSGLRKWIGVSVPFVIVWVLFQNSLKPHIVGNHTPTSVSTISTLPPILRPLASIPDGVQVYADDRALAQVSEGKPLTQITISENPTGNRWTLVKMDGHVYLLGFIGQADDLSQLQGKPLNVFNDDNSGELEGEKTSRITVRIDGIPSQKSSGNESYSGITVLNFQIDPRTTLGDWR